MTEDYRILNPVGHGGFDVECIDGKTIVFDCGSKNTHLIENCILHYQEMHSYYNKSNKIDYVFLSHFDNDHVNGLSVLKKYFDIQNVIVPYIPRQYRVLYNYVTDNSVINFFHTVDSGKNIHIMESLLAKGNSFSLLRVDGYQRIQSCHNKWEWIYNSFFSSSQWEELRQLLAKKYGLDFGNISEEDENFDCIKQAEELNFDKNWIEALNSLPIIWGDYRDNQLCIPEIKQTEYHERFNIESYMSEIELSDEDISNINKAVGEVSGGKSKSSFAKNENGLIMLSKKFQLSQTAFAQIYYFPLPLKKPLIPLSFMCGNIEHSIKDIGKLSACIYTGDMRLDVKSCPAILDFLIMAGEPVLLFQIPHHGSSHNSKGRDLCGIPSAFFFWHDRDYSRINKNTSITRNLILKDKLIIIDTLVGLWCHIFI